MIGCNWQCSGFFVAHHWLCLNVFHCSCVALSVHVLGCNWLFMISWQKLTMGIGILLDMIDFALMFLCMIGCT